VNYNVPFSSQYMPLHIPENFFKITYLLVHYVYPPLTLKVMRMLPNMLKVNRALFAACFMWASSLTYSLTLKMEVTCSSETSVDFQRTTWHYIPEDRTLKIGLS
jgi:hypothetical protein